MIRGWLRKKDIRPFTGCRVKEVDTIWNDIHKQMKKEGIESMDGIILTRRLIKYLGLAEKDIIKAYENTKKADGK